MKQYNIPEIDLVIVDLYPFEETVAKVSPSDGGGQGEALIIEKIDIGGPSMIRGAAKNFKDVAVVAAKTDYALLEQLLNEQKGETTIEQRRAFAAKAFEVVAHYDLAIYNYFHPQQEWSVLNKGAKQSLRYGENPHQQATFFGDLGQIFTQLHGKELSYNNLVDVDAALQLIEEFTETTFAIIKHTNVCGISCRPTLPEAWKVALSSDPESAFGGVLVCNVPVDRATADAISEIFFEVLIAPSFAEDALKVLQAKKNRILLQLKTSFKGSGKMYKNILNGTLEQGTDEGNYSKWEEAGGRETTATEKADLEFANIVCKHLKSNAIALVKNKQLIGKGCGQTSRIDSLRQALDKAKQFQFDLQGAVMASDAFFPFDDCVKMGHAAGISAFIQPGGSVRDKDSIDYCRQHNLVMVITGLRHFKH
jgi:phosphoribosylaminoimidazolecarboxamide formyltransferase/IMP cyclohydrolase